MTSIEIEDITWSDVKKTMKNITIKKNCVVDKCRYKATTHYGLCKHHCGEHKRDREDCVICTDSVKKPISCGHWIHFECIMATGKKECPLCMMTLKLTKEEQQQFKQYNKNRCTKRNNVERYRNEDELYMTEAERFGLYLDAAIGNDLVSWNNRIIASLSVVQDFANSFFR